MINIQLFSFMLICFILGVLSGYIVKKSKVCSLGAGVLCFAALVIIALSVALNDGYRGRVEKYGTYPDTTITIKNGVSDTTIVHIVKSQK